MRYLFPLAFIACTPSAPAPKASSPGVIKGTIDVKADLKDKVQPTDTIYIIARKSASGPPLAVKRISPPAFPLSYELSEKDVMMGGPFEGDVEITVRVDKDGDAMSKNPGDLVGKSAGSIKVGDTSANLTIDQTL